MGIEISGIFGNASHQGFACVGFSAACRGEVKEVMG